MEMCFVFVGGRDQLRIRFTTRLYYGPVDMFDVRTPTTAILLFVARFENSKKNYDFR